MLLVDILCYVACRYSIFLPKCLEDMNTSNNFYINKKETGAQVLVKFIK